MKIQGIDEESGKTQEGFVYYNEDTHEVLVTYPDDFYRKRLYNYLATPQLFTMGDAEDSHIAGSVGHYNGLDLASRSREMMLLALSSMEDWVMLKADWRNPIKDDLNTLKSLNGEIMYRLI